MNWETRSVNEEGGYGDKGQIVSAGVHFIPFANARLLGFCEKREDE